MAEHDLVLLIGDGASELAAGAAIGLAGRLPDVSGFDAVLAGTPNWCGLMAPPVSSALARLPLLLRERGSGVRDLFDAAMLSRGIACEPTWESVSTEALVEAVRHGLGVSVLPLSLVAEHVASGALRLVRVRGVDLGRSLLAIRHRGRELTPGRVALLEALRGAALGQRCPEAPTTR